MGYHTDIVIDVDVLAKKYKDAKKKNNNGLPYRHCDRCRCTSKKYKDAHKEHILY